MLTSEQRGGINMLIDIKNAVVHYDKVIALKEASLNLNNGEIITLIGSNGAGKSTLLRSLSGLVKISSGEIWFDNKRIDKLPPERIAAAGISHVPEGSHVFPDMTVLENLYMGAYLRKDKKEIKNTLEKVYEHFPRLRERKKQSGNSLSGGEKQMLAIGRALMAKPKLLLMDEPSLGLAPIVVQEIGEVIKSLNKEGVSIILVEQNARMALKLAQRGYVFEKGKIVLEGNTSELISNKLIKEIYLGGA